MSRVLWNPNVESDPLVTEWMQGVYGKAAPPMRAWFDLLHKRAAAPNAHLTCYAPTPDEIFGGELGEPSAVEVDDGLLRVENLKHLSLVGFCILLNLLA